MRRSFIDCTLNLGICNCSRKVLSQSENISDRCKHMKIMVIFGYEWPIGITKPPPIELVLSALLYSARHMFRDKVKTYVEIAAEVEKRLSMLNKVD